MLPHHSFQTSPDLTQAMGSPYSCQLIVSQVCDLAVICSSRTINFFWNGGWKYSLEFLLKLKKDDDRMLDCPKVTVLTFQDNVYLALPSVWCSISCFDLSDTSQFTSILPTRRTYEKRNLCYSHPMQQFSLRFYIFQSICISISIPTELLQKSMWCVIPAML